jgi:serine/threonine-protein kinase
VRADNKQPLTSRIGAYEIIRPLAKGGMAELFLVRMTGPEGFEKVLVLKRILPHYVENPKFVRAFLDEAKLVAGFDHPHIAHVHDMGTADASYYFTMEFVHGVDLRTILKRSRRDRSPLPLEHIVLIIKNIASALHYAHERRGVDGRPLGIVHRDVSPSNIIVSYEGAPKLIDFGIAKARSSSMKTQTGALKGKVSYMSPEQAKGTPIDRRTDVFALGIVLWELIANRRLLKGDNEMATIQRIINEPVGSPRDFRHDCPPALERIVDKALALEVEQRYATAADFEHALDDFAIEHRLKQSSSLLSAELKERFSLEIELWERAQAGTVTVTDAIMIADERTIRVKAVPPGPDDLDDDDESSLDESFGDRPRRPHVDSAALPTVKLPAVREAAPTAPTTVVRAAPSSKKWLAIAGGIAAALVAVIVIAVAVGLSREDDAPAPATNVAAPPPAPEPTPQPAPEPERAPVTAPPIEIDMPPERAAKREVVKKPKPRAEEPKPKPRAEEPKSKRTPKAEEPKLRPGLFPPPG